MSPPPTPSVPGRPFLLAGLLPLPWFLAFATAAGALRPEYTVAAQHVSELMAAPGPPRTLAEVAAPGSGAAFVLRTA